MASSSLPLPFPSPPLPSLPLPYLCMLLCLSHSVLQLVFLCMEPLNTINQLLTQPP